MFDRPQSNAARQSALLFATLLFVAAAAPRGAFAQSEFDVYDELASEANAEFGGLDDESSSAQRRSAIVAGDELIQWLDEFQQSADYAALAESDQTAVTTDRHRWQYNVSRQLMLMDACDEARDRLQILVEEGVRDAELQPRVTAAYNDALECLDRPATGWLVVEVTPGDAMLVANGETLGSAERPYRLALGHYALRVEAPGHSPEFVEVELRDADAEVVAGPVSLARIPVVVVAPDPADARRAPSAGTVLIGAGASSVVGAIGLYAASRRHRRLADAPDEGFELDDPAREDRIVRNYRIGAAVAAVAGLAGLGTGLAMVRRGRGEPHVSLVPEFGPGSAGLSLRATR